MKIQTLIRLIREHPRIILACMLVLITGTIYLCFRNFILEQRLSDLSSTPDEVIKITSEDKQTTSIKSTTKTFQAVQKYNSSVQPTEILYWGSSSLIEHENKDDLKSINHDSVTSSSLPVNMSGISFFSLPVTTMSTIQDSLVQILLDRKTFQISSYNRDIGKYLTRSYEIDLDKYSYNWTRETFSKRRRYWLSIAPYISVRYQVFNKVPTIGTGISFKTRMLNYNIGLSLSHDSRLSKPLYPDLEMSLTYTFREWRK